MHPVPLARKAQQVKTYSAKIPLYFEVRQKGIGYAVSQTQQ
jgi:hypothetical protein